MGHKSRRVWRGWGIALALLILLAGAAAGFLLLQPSATLWEPAIRAFEEQDRRQPPAPGQVVFAGSSSIRFWDTLATDMAPVPVLNRGFGGARLRDVLYYAVRVITPYRPLVVGIYGG